MKKVLMIGSIHPYHRGAGNCIHAVADYLPDYGWEPIVLTMPLEKKTDKPYTIHEVGYENNVKKIIKKSGYNPDESLRNQINLGSNKYSKAFVKFSLKALQEVLLFPDQYKKWEQPAFEKGCELIEFHDIKAIISDCPPITGNIVAHRLTKKYDLPWIVYLSHLWSLNNGYSYSRIRRVFDQRLEIKTFQNADALITHSEPLVEKLKTIHKNKWIFSIIEGYNPTIVNDPPVPLTKSFSFTYTGSFAPKYREPGQLFRALSHLIATNAIDKKLIEVRFYGAKENWIEEEINKFGLQDVVRQYGKIPMTDALQAQRESQVLYNPKWDDPEEPGLYSGKIFEYLASRRPILATGKYHDVVNDLLEHTHAGCSVETDDDIENAIKKLYDEYLREGKIVYRGDLQNIENYSNQAMIKKFVNAVESIEQKKSG